MTQREKIAYLAGIIDGEGSIMLWMNKKTKIRGQFNMRVNVSSTDKCLIDWLINNFGGCSYAQNSPSRKANPHWKKQYTWEIKKPDLLQFLNMIYPFLVIKKSRCELAIKFRETFVKRERELSDKTLATRIDLFNQMKHLNLRGA